MSERSSYDALPHHIPKEIRSELLDFEAEVVNRNLPEGEEAKILEFKYDKLPANKKRIRVLRLWPGVLQNPQIDCEMFEAEFDDADELIMVSKATDDGKGKGPAKDVNLVNGSMSTVHVTHAGPANQKKEKKNIVKYEALSWRWGDEDNGKYAVMIHKDGILYRKRVSQTLGLALKYLRYEKDRFLWIDAICINQKDPDERSSQVAMMSSVYTAADKACVWLGEDDVESTMAIKFVREEISQLKNFDRLCTEEQYAEKWKSLLVLMQRPWFSRRWVVQEIVLAKKATVYCGPDKIEWPELAIAVELFVEVETATHRLSELMKKDAKFTLIPNWFEHISELGASLLVNATARVYRGSELNDGTLVTRGAFPRSLLSLEYLVTSLSIFDCGRPHDSVYALVAIARDARPFAPSALMARTYEETLVAEVCSHFVEEKPYILDYNSPYPDVCRDFTQFCIERCASIDKIQALDILCRPWAKDWLPGEVIVSNDEKEGQKKDQRSKHSKNEAEKPNTLMKRDWVIRIKAGELKENLGKLDGATDSDKLATFLKGMEINPPSPDIAIPTQLEDEEEKLVEIRDDRDMKKYWDHAEKKKPIRPIIKKWFTKPKKEEDDKPKEEPPKAEVSNGTQKVSSKKRRPPPEPVQVDTPSAAGETEETNTPCPDEKELGLPSWVAKITAAPFDIFPHPGMDMVKMGRKNADPLVGIPQDGHRNYNAGQTKKLDLKSLKFRKRPRCHHYSLYVKGFWLDTVESVAQVSQGGAIPGEWLDLAGWSEALRPPRPGKTLADPPHEFWRTLVADRGMYDRNPPYYYARACKETILKGGLRSGAVDTTALIYNERNSIVAEFCRRVQAVIWNRALIKTEKGYLGLASDKVQVGDMVCIIYGCTVPIILRKKKWKLESERKLEEFEDGVEAMKNLVRKCEKNRARKAHWENSKKIAKENKTEDNVKDIQDQTEIFNIEESIKHLVRKVEKDQDRTERWTKSAKATLEEKRQEEVEYTRDRLIGNFNTQKKRAKKIYKYKQTNKPAYTRDVSDYESEDVTDPDTDPEIEEVKKNGEKLKNGSEVENGGEVANDEAVKKDKEPQEGKQRNKRKEKQEKATKKDPYRHYEFFGEAYIHGMMDGDAVRKNVYNFKPDHLFEIR